MRRYAFPASRKIDANENHVGPTFQKSRTQEIIREKQDAANHVTESWGMKFPPDEKAHIPQGVVDAVCFIAESETRHYAYENKLRPYTYGPNNV